MAFIPNIPYDQILKPGTPVFFYSLINHCCVGGFIECFRVCPDGSIKYKVGKSICGADEIKLTYYEVATPIACQDNNLDDNGNNRDGN